MKYIRFIAAFVALVVSAACTNSDIDDITPINPVGSKGDLQIVGRITQYSDCEVVTRSKKEGDESKVTSMGLALFPIENGAIGNCLYYDFKLGGSIVFIVDRHDDVFDNYTDTKFAMYIFANMQDAVGFPTTSEAGVGKTLEEFTKCAAAANKNVKDVPANGFPMVGSLGNKSYYVATEFDGKELILKPAQTDANVDGLPLVDGKPTDNLEIPLKSMYAKFSFTITVKPDQEIVGNKAPRFDLLSYAVNNIPATVDSNSSTNSDNDVITTPSEVSVGSYAQGATVAEFYFYLPERYLTPSITNIDNVLPTELKKGTYGTDVDADQNGYRDEDERYHQRFKNKLVEGKAATYVTITGKYTDHQGHVYDVDYNIYLGGNNYDDFNVLRNTHYDNSITIRGISASDDQAANKEAISIDWRVNVDRSTPLVINLRRESLLDAHIEVRPLRLRLVGEDIPTGTSATVSVLNQDGTANNIPSWIRLELSGNSSDHITDATNYPTSVGKRKYFTTTLLSEISSSLTVRDLSGTNQTVWIYVDENLDTKSRAAIVRVTYDGVDKDFKIVQHGLHLIEGASTDGVAGTRDYYIEEYEEYLYNYDAEDSYGQTKEEGMPWGLNGVQLSNEHDSFVAPNNTSSYWTDYLKANPLPDFDFYLETQDGSALKSGGESHKFAGQEFTSEIYTKSQGKSSQVNILTMAQQASGAVEYCYNRNKRNANGSIAKVEWYLPSADELEEIIIAGYSSFKEFQDNYYWTSQPAYIRNIFFYQYQPNSYSSSTVYTFDIYNDNTKCARATKVLYKDGEYKPAKSGLKEFPDNFASIDDTKKYDSNCVNRGCFYQMRYWKRWYKGLFSGGWATEYGDDKHNYDVGGDEEYHDSVDDVRYHVHLGHLDDLMQEGYHERTRKNRVRCVRVKPTTQE